MIFAVGLIAGCAASGLSSPIAIRYSYEDSIPLKAFRLSYRNETSRPVCLTPDNWPNGAGKLDQALSRASVEIEGQQARYVVKDFNTGYCPECAVRLAPGESITGVIPYGEFSIPEEFHTNKKILHFQPYALICK
jgi:hypothetical protein